MSRARVVLLVSIVAHALGWALPVMDDYRGCHAFRVALSPLWPYEQFHIPPGRLVYLSVASALTNVVFAVIAIAALAGARTDALAAAARGVGRRRRDAFESALADLDG